MAARTLDTLIVDLLFRGDTRGLENANRKLQQVERQVQTVVRGMQVAFTAALGLGGVAFVTGSKIERELLNLRTQLGETEESVEAIEPALEDLSRDTAVAFDRLAAGYFALRSAGLSTEAAMNTLAASAHGVNAGMGDIRDIAFTAGGAVNAYGEDVMSGVRATDILLSTVQKGNLIASDLTRGFGELLQVAPGLGVEMEQLGAIIAGATGPSVPANVVMTQLRQVLFGLLRPTETAKKQFEALGIDASELARRVDEDLVGALQWLRQEAGEDREAFSRLFESQEAVGLLFTITGEKASDYREALDAIQNSTGAANRAHEIWAQSGLAQAEKGTNEAKLTLNDLYNNAVVPLLQLFGKLNPVIQQFIVLVGGASVASSLFGGPSLGRGIAALTIKLVRLRWVNRQLRIMRVVVRRQVIPALRSFVGWLRSGLLALGSYAATLRGQTIPALWRTTTATWASVKASVAARWATLSSAVANSAFVLSLKAAAISTWRFIAGLSVMRIAQLAGAAAAGVATGATWAFNAALLANPITWVVLAIGALIAGLVLLVKNWDAARSAIGRFWAMTRRFLGAIIVPFAPFIGIPLLIIGNWGTLKTFFGDLWDWIVDKTTWAWDKVSGIFDAIGGFFGFGGGEVEVRTSTSANPAPPAVPTLDEGGIVRRPTLAMLAMNRQPEAVIPLTAFDRIAEHLQQMLDGLDRFIADFKATQGGKNFVANLPVLMDPSQEFFPTVPPRALAGAGAGPTYIDNRTVNVNVGEIVVNALPGQSPTEIAQVVTERLHEQIRAIPPAFDSGIQR